MRIIGISIHAPRTGSDSRVLYTVTPSGYFNPRSPHGERPSLHTSRTQCRRFQSTLPARGATKHGGTRIPGENISIHAPRTGSDWETAWSWKTTRYFNPRSPHGERRYTTGLIAPEKLISIHAPRTGSDVSPLVAWNTHPFISIHAPRTGSDLLLVLPRARLHNFNPRSPHGERPGNTSRASRQKEFQSTLPARGATHIAPNPAVYAKISIHAPRTGSDMIHIKFM